MTNRKQIPFWKYLIFSIIALAVAAGIGMQLFNIFVISALAISEVKRFSLLVFIILLLLAGSMYYATKRNKNNIALAILFKRYSYLFLSNAVILGYIAISASLFFEIKPSFFAVDYTNNKVTHLFDFEPDPDFNPQLARIIDSKFTPDGEYLQFTVGGFRSNPEAQGAIYRYHLKDKRLERITELDSNNGFADFSKDNASMVFRSGRNGQMDIYIKENDSVINLTNSPAKENFPVISYDGNQLAFCSDVNGKDMSGVVKTMDVFISKRLSDNSWSVPKQLTSYSGQEGHPHFSPDGKWLIYTTEEFGINDEQPLVQPYIFSPQMYGEITVIRLEDGKKYRLTHNKWEDGAPLWISGN
jgi:hypothetical protein